MLPTAASFTQQGPNRQPMSPARNQHIAITDLRRRIQRGRPRSFAGKFFSFSEMRVNPKPVQEPHPPIWIGGASDAALHRAARFAALWLRANAEGLTDEVGSRQLYMSSLYEYLPLFEADAEGRRAGVAP
jgi:alkanesulfonate monooxygenase SsuD/methylene tetrahydromethanopterin reductase-like flavin-dependent oxidoreductase (luciferase family)